jgi:hypothetical protein
MEPRICIGCKITYGPTHSKQLRCSACFKIDSFGIGPPCACGCGKTVNHFPGKNKWYRYVDGHHQAKPTAAAVASRLEGIKRHTAAGSPNRKPLPERPCTACEAVYLPTSTSQRRCLPCLKDKNWGLAAPFCGCGCGKQVRWSYMTKGWSKFVQGHHQRLAEYKQLAAEGTQKREYTYVTHEFVCQSCKKTIQADRPRRKFCSKQCRGKSMVGEKSILWKGGIRPDGYQRDFTSGRVQHREVMEKMIKRPLNEFEIVHHIDCNRSNNDPGNLYLFHCDRCHMHFHKKAGAVLSYFYLKLHDGEGQKFGMPPSRKKTAKRIGAEWAVKSKH